MHRFFIRFVAAVLVSCLIVDPAFCSGCEAARETARPTQFSAGFAARLTEETLAFRALDSGSGFDAGQEAPAWRQLRSGLYRKLIQARTVPSSLRFSNLSWTEWGIPAVFALATGFTLVFVRGSTAAFVLAFLSFGLVNMIHKPVRVTETDLESRTDAATLELLRINREWDTSNKIPENALAQLQAVRDILGIAPWPADQVPDGRQSKAIAKEVDEMSGAFRLAQEENNDEELNKLNAKAQVLLDERVALQLALAEKFVRGPRNKNLSSALAAIVGAANTLDRKRIELYWQRVRSYKTGRVRTFAALDWQDEALEIFDLEGWDIREKALGSVTTVQQRYRTRVIQGVTVTRLEWTRIVYDSILKAFRAQIHTLDSQQSDIFDIINQGAQMRHVELLLDPPGHNPTALARKKALDHLVDLHVWADRGHVKGKKYAEVELAQALEALSVNDVKKTLERIHSARKVLRESRLPEIERIRDFVHKRATSLLDQIRKERQWADEVRELRDGLPEKATPKVYVQWLDGLSSLFQATPYQKPPEAASRAKSRLAPTLDMLRRLSERTEAKDVEAMRASIKENVRAIRNDLSFVGKKSDTPPVDLPAQNRALDGSS